MTKKTLVVILAAVLALVMLGGIAVRIRGSKKSKSSDESSIEELTQEIIIPSEMPVNISLPIPAGFTETSSEYYNKYFVRDDASIIVTGEKIPIAGKQLEEYTADVLAQYEKSVDEFQLINNTAYKSGAPCKVLEFTYALIGEKARQDFQCITAVLLKDNCSYLVTCKSKKETFASYRALFLMMIEKITILDTQPDPAQGTTVPAAAQTDFGADFSGTAP